MGSRTHTPAHTPGEPRVIVRIARTMGGDETERMTAMTVPLKILEGIKKDYFEEEIEKDRLETYYLGPHLKKVIGECERRTNEDRPPRLPEKVWDLHFEKIQKKMAKKRHLLRGDARTTHALGLEANTAVLVANTIMDGNAKFRDNASSRRPRRTQ